MLSPQKRKTEAGAPSSRARVRGPSRSRPACHPRPPPPRCPRLTHLLRRKLRRTPKRRWDGESKMAGEEDPGRRGGLFTLCFFQTVRGPRGTGSPKRLPRGRPPPLRQVKCEQRPWPLPPGSVPCRVPYPARGVRAPGGCRQARSSGWLGARGPACVAGRRGDLPPLHTQVTGQPRRGLCGERTPLDRVPEVAADLPVNEVILDELARRGVSQGCGLRCETICLRLIRPLLPLVISFQTGPFLQKSPGKNYAF